MSFFCFFEKKLFSQKRPTADLSRWYTFFLSILKLQNIQGGIIFVVSPVTEERERDGKVEARRQSGSATAKWKTGELFPSFGEGREGKKKTRNPKQARYLPRTALSPFFPASLSSSLSSSEERGEKKRRGLRASVALTLPSLLRVREPSPALRCAPGRLSCCGPFDNFVKFSGAVSTLP